ncbi:MAG: sugar phosphate isomerase/epimerase [Burkholderiales bacterium]|nr:sugar phosphate isomerase/epimerase [Burkholderiales bacterium]
MIPPMRPRSLFCASNGKRLPFSFFDQHGNGHHHATDPSEPSSRETFHMLPNSDLSFQLWSSRADTDLDAQFRALEALGYTDMQPFHAQYDDPTGMKRLLDTHGLTAKTGHFNTRMFEDEFERIVAAAGTLGMSLVVAPWLNVDERPREVEGWKRWGAKLREYSRRCAAAGLQFAWQNRDFEFVRFTDGSWPIEHLLGDEAAWEIDVAWVARAGVDPKPWIERYRGGIPAVHVKDLAPAGTTAEGGWADVGHGVIDWQPLWELAVAAGSQPMVAEHDATDDYMRFARRSIVSMKRYAGLSV